MSGIRDLILAILFAAVVSWIVRKNSNKGKLPDWWMWFALVPLLSLGMAIAILLFPRQIPEGWQEGGFDAGFADYVALIFYGIILPIAYLALAFSVALLARIAKLLFGKK